jgi:hypothetical protein
MSRENVPEVEPRQDERRKGDELLPEVIALIASCGDEVRESDRSALPQWVAERRQRERRERERRQQQGAGTVPSSSPDETDAAPRG